MPKILFAFVLLFLRVDTYCQLEYAPIGATWYYSRLINFAGEEGYIKITSERDTVLNGKDTKILSQQYFDIWGDTTRLENFYTYQENDTVFYWFDNAFRPVYYLAPELGDTLEIYSSVIICEGEDHFGKIKVDSITSLNINGHDLKEIWTSPVEGSPYTYRWSYLEIVGGLLGFFPENNSTDCGIDVFQQIGALRCYSDSFLGFYQVDENIPCDTLKKLPVSIIETDQKLNLPTLSQLNDILEIRIPDGKEDKILTLRIFEITGSILYTTKLNQDYTSMNLSSLKRGIYIIQIVNINKILYYEKLLLN